MFAQTWKGTRGHMLLVSLTKQYTAWCIVLAKKIPIHAQGTLVFNRQLFHAVPFSMHRCCHHLDEDPQAQPQEVFTS